MTSKKIELTAEELLIRASQEDGYSTCLYGGTMDSNPGLEALEKEAAEICYAKGWAREEDSEELFVLTASGLAKAKKLLRQEREIRLKKTLFKILEACEDNNWEFHLIEHDQGSILLVNNVEPLDAPKYKELLSEAIETLIDKGWVRKSQGDLYVVTSSGKTALQSFEDPEATTNRDVPVKKDSRKVFIVHGRDEIARLEVEKLLKKLELEPVVLFEQPNKGRSLIEKFEQESEPVGFAVVLLTPDDLGCIKPDNNADKPVLVERARQNVVFELGFFFGTLKRKNVVALVKGQMEHPSDIHGVVYLPMDQSGAWRVSLAKEIKEAGVSVDLNLL